MKTWTVMEMKYDVDWTLKNCFVLGAFSTRELAVEQVRRIHDELKKDCEKHSNENAPRSVSELKQDELRPHVYSFTRTMRREERRYEFLIDDVVLDEFV